MDSLPGANGREPGCVELCTSSNEPLQLDAGTTWESFRNPNPHIESKQYEQNNGQIVSIYTFMSNFGHVSPDFLLICLPLYVEVGVPGIFLNCDADDNPRFSLSSCLSL